MNRIRSFSYFGTALLCMCLAAGSARGQFVIGENFTGLTTFSDAALYSGGFFVPPDSMGAVGPKDVVSFVNLAYAVYDKTTGAQVGPTLSAASFWNNAGLGNFGTSFSDPRVLYDRVSGRWFVAMIRTNSNSNDMLVARSNTSDPTMGWKAVSFRANPSIANNFADFPQLGVDKDAIYISSNNFLNGTAFDGETVTVIPKKDLLKSTPTAAGRTAFENLTCAAPGVGCASGFTLQPIVSQGSGAGLPHDLLATDGFTPSTVLIMRKINGPATSPTLNPVTTFIPVSQYWNDQNAHQPDGTRNLNAGDFRISGNAILVRGNIWAVDTILPSATIGNTAYDEVRWYRIDAATDTVMESGVIGDAHHDYLYPSIAVNAKGAIVIGYTRTGDSTTTDFPGSWATTGIFDGHHTTAFNAPILLAAGSGNYHINAGGRNRWGDYSATTIDPLNPDDFWTVQEFAIPGAGSFPQVWGTRITEIVGPSAVPEPGTLSLIGIGAACVGLYFRRRRSR